MESDDLFRAVQEQAFQLEELAKHPGWLVLVDYLHEVMAGDKKAILNGYVESHDDYKSKTGKLVGIHTAIDAPASVRKMVNDELKRRAERDQAAE